MTEDKSLLKKIREKELEVSVRIDDVRVEADQIIERARKESTAITKKSEEEGKKAADEYLQREMKRIQSEAESIRVHSREQVRTVREKGEKNVPKAIEGIIDIILPG